MGGNVEPSEQSYLRPLYRHFLRSLAWRTGLGDEFFENLPCDDDNKTDSDNETSEEASQDLLNAAAEVLLYEELSI